MVIIAAIYTVHLDGGSVSSLINLSLLGLSTLAIFGLGSSLTRWLRLRAWSICAQLAYSLAFGLGALMTLLFILGLLGALVPLAAWSLLLLGLLLLPFGAPLARDVLAALRGRVRQLRSAHWGWWALVILLALQAALHLIADLAPPLEGDTVTQYLLTARYWAQAGRYWQPDHIWASPLPGHILMLSTWAMLLRGPSWPVVQSGFSLSTLLTGFLMSLVLALAVYALARVRYGARVGLAAAVLIFLMPDASYLAESGKIDLGWALFETLALAALLRWTTEEAPSSRWLLISALMTGFALTAKSQAVLSLPFLAAWIAIIAVRRYGMSRGWLFAIRSLAAFGVVALLVGLPYLGYNAVIHHNPFYPVFADLFTRVLDATPSYRSELGTEVFYPWTISGYLNHLWDASLGHPPGFYLGFWAGPAYLMLLPLGLLLPHASQPSDQSRPDPVVRGLLLYVFAFSIAWFLVKQAVRHFLPGFVLLAVVSAIMLVRVDEQARWLRNLVYAGLALTMAVGLGFFAGLNTTNGALLAALGVRSPEQFIAHWVDQVVTRDPLFPDSELLAYARTGLPAEARVVNFHANLALYFPQDQLSVTLREPENAWLTGDETALLDVFDRYQADYLLVWKGEYIPLSDRPLILQPSFYETHGEMVFESPRTYLYRINH